MGGRSTCKILTSCPCNGLLTAGITIFSLLEVQETMYTLERLKPHRQTASPRDNHAGRLCTWKPRAGSNSSCQPRPSLEQRLGLGIERLALCSLATHRDEALEVQGLAGCLGRVGPFLESAVGKGLLGTRGRRLGDNLAALVLGESGLSHATCGLCLLAVEDGGPGVLALGNDADPLCLHGFHAH